MVRLRPVVVCAVLCALLVALLAGCSGADAAPVTSASGPAATGFAPPPPDPDPTSPTSPSGVRTGPVGLASPPAVDRPSRAPAAPNAAPNAVPTGAAAVSSNTRFCDAVGSGASVLASGGLDLLRSLGAAAGSNAPTVASAVQQVQADLRTLAAASPQAVRAASDTLVRAWDALAAALERAGWDRTRLVQLGLSHLTTPEVAAAWTTLSRYALDRCGRDLGHVGG